MITMVIGSPPLLDVDPDIFTPGPGRRELRGIVPTKRGDSPVDRREVHVE
jgi:hypothetical protein